VNAGGAGAGGVNAGGAGTGGVNAGGAGAGGVNAGGAGAGGAGPGLTPILCPETDAIHPKNPATIVITDGKLTEDAHWTSDHIYVLSVSPGAFSAPGLVVGGHTLTIDAGTIVCIDYENALGVGSDGTPGEVHINGTAENPVIFTAMPSSQDPTRPNAYHGGLDIGAFEKSTISHLTMWYGGPGGGNGAWAVHVQDTAVGTDATKPILLDHVTIGEIQSSGLYVGSPLGIDPASSVHILGFSPHDDSGPDLNAVADIDFFAGKSLATSLTIDPGIPAGAAHINLRTSTVGALDGPAELSDLGVAYRFHDRLTVAGPGAVLTLHEGVTFGLDNVISVGDFETDQKGDLVFLGSAAKPVTVTSSAPTPAAGDWNGILFVTGEFNPGTTKIDHAEILYGGVLASSTDITIDYCSDEAAGAIMLQGPANGSTYAGPTITNTHIAHSLGDGIVAGANAGGAHLTTDYSAPALNITFDDVAGTKINTAPCP
jgi:hypothetical protein